jgi:hypothetical protein
MSDKPPNDPAPRPVPGQTPPPPPQPERPQPTAEEKRKPVTHVIDEVIRMGGSGGVG